MLRNSDVRRCPKADDEKEKKRVKGIEPSPKAWEAFILPLNYTRDLYGQRTNWPRMGQAGSPVIASTGINQDQLGA